MADENEPSHKEFVFIPYTLTVLFVFAGNRVNDSISLHYSL